MPVDPADDHRYMLPWATLVHTATFLLQGLDDEMQEAVGLSLLEQNFLSQLQKRGGGLKMTDFADVLLLSKAGMTKLVDRLEEEDLVSRVPSQEDRRVTLVRLTDAGVRRVERSREILTSWTYDNFARHLEGEELDGLVAALRKVLEGNDRWEGQMDYVRGLGPHPSKRPPQDPRKTT